MFLWSISINIAEGSWYGRSTTNRCLGLRIHLRHSGVGASVLISVFAVLIIAIRVTTKATEDTPIGTFSPVVLHGIGVDIPIPPFEKSLAVLRRECVLQKMDEVLVECLIMELASSSARREVFLVTEAEVYLIGGRIIQQRDSTYN